VLVEASVPLSLAIGDTESAERYLQLLVPQAARTGYRIYQPDSSYDDGALGFHYA
jgi:hypothetical protein